MMGSIAAVTATAVFMMFADRRWIMHGKKAPKGSTRRLVFLTIGRGFDVIAFVALLIILFFLLMGI